MKNTQYQDRPLGAPVEVKSRVLIEDEQAGREDYVMQMLHVQCNWIPITLCVPVRLDNFRKATVWAGRGHKSTRARGRQGKGQRLHLAWFVEAILNDIAMPIPLKARVVVTRVTIAVLDRLSSGHPERI